ncbi:hypothetical protein PLESTM_000344600 [Pleodorina starrii]|nr:hypothetical protein PLESTM_000344600 [Pleodorina starrii]
MQGMQQQEWRVCAIGGPSEDQCARGAPPRPPARPGVAACTEWTEWTTVAGGRRSEEIAPLILIVRLVEGVRTLWVALCCAARVLCCTCAVLHVCCAARVLCCTCAVLHVCVRFNCVEMRPCAPVSGCPPRVLSGVLSNIRAS